MNKLYAYAFLTTIVFSTTCMEMVDVCQQKEQNNDALIKQLHDTAYSFMNFTQCCDYNDTEKSPLTHSSTISIIDYQGKFDLDDYNKKAATLVSLMRKARNIGITEDCMGKFAYNKSDNYYFTQHSSKRRYRVDLYVPLVFNCLKQYIQTHPSRTRNNTLHPSTQAVINVTKSVGKQSWIFSTNDSVARFACLENDSKPRKIHPLTKAIVFLTTTSDIQTLETLTNCLYSGPQNIASYLELNEWKPHPDVTNFDTFYDEMVKLIHPDDISIHKIHEAMQLIDYVKTLQNISQGLNISSIVLAHKKQEPQGMMETIGSWFDNEDESNNRFDRRKKLIANFCTLVEEYNKSRGKRKTPTSKQYFLYLKIMEHNIGLPDTFDTKVFSNKHYAFDEFSELVNDAVELCKETYPEKFYKNRSKMVQ